MNFGEIRILRFKRPQGGAEAIPTHLGINTAAQLIIIDEKMPIIFYVFVAIAHVCYRKAFLSAMIEAIEVSLGLVPSFFARLVQPDAVRPSWPIPMARGSEPPAMVTPMIGCAVPVRCTGGARTRIRHTVTIPVVIGLLAFHIRHMRLGCDGCETLRSARFMGFVTV
jgi:hypothetical protein